MKFPENLSSDGDQGQDNLEAVTKLQYLSKIEIFRDLSDFQTNRARNQWVAFYSERSAWSGRDYEKFNEGLRRAGAQAVADFQKMLKSAGSSRNAPSEEIGPRIPGNFYKTEEE